MASYIERRKFLATLGGAAVVGPYAAVAQQASKTAKVGILYPGTAASLPSRVAGLWSAPLGPDSLRLVI
jgi:hypothetical protein